MSLLLGFGDGDDIQFSFAFLFFSLAAELTCTSPHFKKEWVTGESMFGELTGGYMFKCSLTLARKSVKNKFIFHFLLFSCGLSVVTFVCVLCWIWCIFNISFFSKKNTC